MRASKKMERSILQLVKRWTSDLSMCDGRDLGGVAITLDYGNEREKEAPARFWDYCRVEIQDVSWDGRRDRRCRDVYYVCHNGDYEGGV